MKFKQLKMRKFKFNFRSIKVRLIVVPIMVVVICMFGIGIVSTYSTRQSLIDEMTSNGHFVLEEFIDRLADNSRSLDVINNNIEDQVRAAARATSSLQGSLSNERLTQLANDLGVDQIHYYNP